MMPESARLVRAQCASCVSAAASIATVAPSGVTAEPSTTLRSRRPITHVPSSTKERTVAQRERSLELKVGITRGCAAGHFMDGS